MLRGLKLKMVLKLTRAFEEHPANVPPGNSPKRFDVLLQEDTVDSISPGDAATFTVILRLVSQPRTRKVDFYLEANYVERITERPASANSSSTRLEQSPVGDIMSEYTLLELKRLSPFVFQDWVIRTKLKGQPSRHLTGDLGIDGYTSDGIPVQVKQSEHIGRNFETAIRRRGIIKGIIVAFSFTQNAQCYSLTNLTPYVSVCTVSLND